MKDAADKSGPPTATRRGSPRSFGWQLIYKTALGTEVWEAPAGERYLLDAGATLERTDGGDHYHFKVI